MTTTPEPTTEALFRAEERRLHRTAWMLLGDREEAEDAVQDAMATLARRGLDELDRPGAYLRTIVVNECRRRMRRQRPRPASGPDLAAFDRHDIEMLDALGSLTARKRAVVVLRFYEDLEVNVIAELLGCAPSTVSSLLHRAMKDMKEILTHD
ncbi:MAG TPA: sigma-70 family RNA polymerase sigma factor [Iamia sp.]|nr:sigma-70 family RNA polymerase sigma factor [Iamia sp.]